MMLAMRSVVAAAIGVALAVVDSGPSGNVMALPRKPDIGLAPASGRGDPTVLVVLDGVRWQEIFHGTDATLGAGAPLRARTAAELMPNLHRIMHEDGAVVGAPGHGSIRASGPNFVSLPSYREIFSGRSTPDCSDNDCWRISRTTFVDDLRDAGGRAAVFASWEKIDRAAAADPTGVVVSAGRPEDDDTSPWPGAGAFRPDRMTASLALQHLEREAPDFLFLGLGEPDEFAHHGNYSGYVGALTAADATLGELLRTLGRMGARGKRTHVLVTTDHGRSAGFRDHGGPHPESARVWLAAMGPRIAARGPVDIDDARLRDIAPTLRAITEIAPADRADDAGRPLARLFSSAGL